jgi:hypothetical protein
MSVSYCILVPNKRRNSIAAVFDWAIEHGRAELPTWYVMQFISLCHHGRRHSKDRVPLLSQSSCRNQADCVWRVFTGNVKKENVLNFSLAWAGVVGCWREITLRKVLSRGRSPLDPLAFFSCSLSSQTLLFCQHLMIVSVEITWTSSQGSSMEETGISV